MIDNNIEFIKLRDIFSELLEPAALDADKACWEFYINSTDDNMKTYQTLQERVYDLYKNEDFYNKFLTISRAGLSDNHLKKQLKNILREFDEELNAGELKKQLRDTENRIASKFNSYVPIVRGKELSKADINKRLQFEKDTELRKELYNAKIKSGDIIKEDMIDFIKLRNKFAQTKGYNNYFEYALAEIYEVDIRELTELLADVYDKAKEYNTSIQNEQKSELAKEFGIEPTELEQYHYGLLLNSNPAKIINKYITSKEMVVNLAKQSYSGMGYDIDNMPIVLDLFPRKNKNTHGFCFDIQAGKDARILANLTDDTNSIDTLFHELGHCVYCLGINENLPYFDRTQTPALTEAIAMMMGDLQQKEDILKDIVTDEILKKFKDYHKVSEAKFINNSMLIIDFEKSMYENPEQDLPTLWHDLRVKYIGANETEPIDNAWATIPHYLSHPAYYQNYFRADIMKAQMYKSLTIKLGKITQNKLTSTYLKDNLFKFGMSVEENALIEHFTGEKLSCTALCENLR